MNVEEDKPPSNKTNMGISTRIFSANDTLAGRFAGIRALWTGDWFVCPVRTSLHSRCYSVLTGIHK